MTRTLTRRYGRGQRRPGACLGVDVRIKGLTRMFRGSRANDAHVRHCFAQNADHLAHNTPFSPFFAEVVCTLGATPPRVVASLPPNGGIASLEPRHAGDTPTASS